VSPAPAHDDLSEILERVLPVLLGREHRALVVLSPSVRLADDAELVPVEVRAGNDRARQSGDALSEGRRARPSQVITRRLIDSSGDSAREPRMTQRYSVVKRFWR